MKKLKEQVENLQLEVSVVKDLSMILDQHFQADRYRDNVYMDNWSISYLMNEYTTLNYLIGNKLSEIEKGLTGDVNELFELERVN